MSTINERIATALGWEPVDRRADRISLDWLLPLPSTQEVELPDFEHSQDALDLYVQPDIERRRGWVALDSRCPGLWRVFVFVDDRRGFGYACENTAALARCLAYLEAVEGGKGDG